MTNKCEAFNAALSSLQGEAPKGFALVPIKPTREMERVFHEEDWEWRDLLAAADSITEDDYYAVYKLSDAFIGEVIQNVAELPDRNSPDDWPDAMLVTSEELQTILLAVHEDVPAVTYPPSAASKIAEQDARIKELEQQLEVARNQPRLTVKVSSFPESNGKRNWTALLVRSEPWEGLIGNCGGITVARGELWNRVAYEAERTRCLIGERDTEPHIFDYGDDIATPEQWIGEVRGSKQSIDAATRQIGGAE